MLSKGECSFYNGLNWSQKYFKMACKSAEWKNVGA